MIVNDYKLAGVKCGAKGITISAEEIVYYAGLVLWLAQFYISRTIFTDFFGGKLITAVRYFCMLIFLIKIVMTEKKIRWKAAAVFITAAAVFVVVQLNINTGMPLIQVLLLIVGARELSFRRICKVILWTCVILWIIPVMFHEVGIFVVERNVYKERVREYLNFNYVSYAAIYFNNIIFCACYAYTDPDRPGRGGNYAKRREIPWAVIVFFTAVAVWLYVVTDTSLPFVTSLLFIALYVVFIKLRLFTIKSTRKWRVAGALTFPALALFTYVIVSEFDGRIARNKVIDRLTHSRISLAKTGLTRYGVHLFGTQIVENTDTNKGAYFYIDSGYMKNLISYGLIVFIMIIAMYSITMYAAVAEHDVMLVIWLFCIAVYSMFNNLLLSPTENGSLLAIWYAVGMLKWRRKKRKYKRVTKRKELEHAA